MIIVSDASLQGWYVVCNGIKTRGPWSLMEKQMHINCLEVLAAPLGLKSFVKDQTGIVVLLHWTIKQLYCISTTWGTVSPQLTDLAKALWIRTLSKGIILPEEYI